MKVFLLILFYVFSGFAYAGNCNAEIEKVTSEITFKQIIEIVEKEESGDDTLAQTLRAIGPVVDLRRNNQFYISNSRFYRKTVNLNGGTFEEKYTAINFSGTADLISSFGLFIGFDNTSCKIRSVSYDVPL